MNAIRIGQLGSVILVVVMLGALLSACGIDSPTGETTVTAGGVVTVGTPTVGLKTCTSCHTVQTADWMLTKHANVEPLGNLYSAGIPTLGQISTCTKNCHDSNGDGAGNSFINGYTGNVARPVVGCESCHGGGSLHDAGAGPIGYAVYTAGVISGATSSLQVSAQFATCTSCHELLEPNDPVNTAATPTHVTSAPTGSDYIIPDTHFATPGVFTGSFDGATFQNIQNITGYAMDYASEKVCTNCHNPHKTADINREWALSAHADKTANNPEFTSTQDPLGYFSGAWAHYNWGAAANYRACQRCHTTTGFSTYADALSAGNTQLARDIQLGLVTLLNTSATPTMGSFKPEMLKCNGCHTDNKGTLRNPGAVTAIYDFPIPMTTAPLAIASHAYPDVNGSNVCMACHTGRESGDTVKGLNDPALLSAGTITFFNFGTRGFINSHYLTAGGTVFTATGFEFEGRSYENLASYRHVDIGSPAVPNSGTNGPCIGCHMSRPGGSGNHLFMPVTRSSDPATAGHIVGIASEVCIYCHTVSGAGGLEDLINERKEEYHEAVEATIYVLDKLGFYFRPANPYYFKPRPSNDVNTRVSVANGNATVTATVGAPLWTGPTNSVFTAAWVPSSVSPDYFKVNADGHYYRIEAATPTTLTLREPYTGPTVANAEYTIIQGRSGGMVGWLTQAGKGIVPAAVTDTDTTGNTTGRYNLGAAFNLNLLEHDPGGYVHNRNYAKRLLYDSIDWADDNRLNYSVGATLNTIQIDGAAPAWKAGAMKYLLPSGVLGIAAERP